MIEILVYRYVAYFVDRILKGAKAADLQVGQPTKFETVIKFKTAKALGIKNPGAILTQATKVIEEDANDCNGENRLPVDFLHSRFPIPSVHVSRNRILNVRLNFDYYKQVLSALLKAMCRRAKSLRRQTSGILKNITYVTYWRAVVYARRVYRANRIPPGSTVPRGDNCSSPRLFAPNA